MLSILGRGVNPNIRRDRGRWLRPIVTIAALGWVVGRTQPGGLGRALASANAGLLLAGTVVYLAAQGISAFRWLQIARASAFPAGMGEILRNYYIGMFFNLFGPATTGGDLVRSLYLAGDGGRRAAAFHSVVVDRLVGFFWLLAIGSAGILAFGRFEVPVSVAVCVVGATSVFAVAMTLGPRFAGRLLPAGGRARAFVDADVRPLWRDSRLLVRISAISILFHVVQIGGVIAVGRAAGLELPWQAYFVIHPIATALGALPISAAGIGVREAGYVYLLTSTTIVPLPQAVAFSLLWLAVLITASAFGGLVFLADRRPSPLTDVLSRTRSSFRDRRSEL